ncbi:hypothetical protein [Bizionia paragorgiae]|jgi:hypothetical protein|uniref:hypothetical protein n=1 Tax=Bizionia paragorgiae TaxID=283786 RepID=UPI003A911658
MFFNKFIISLILIVSTVLTFKGSVSESASVVITEKSTLLINGKSNVNSFSCVYDIEKIKNPIRVHYAVEDNTINFEQTTLFLETTCFDCGGNGINRDFRKTLNTDDYPEIALSLKAVELKPQGASLNAYIDIKIAGISRLYTIPIKLKKKGNIMISGDLKLKLSDFNLKAPNKLFGIISVEDTIEIVFNLELEKQ